MLSRVTLPSTRTQAVYAELKRQIVEGTLPPGARLVIDELARVMGISQSPIREALKRLESERLVSSVPYVGAVVAASSPEELVGEYRMLAVLSGLAARLATPRLTDADFDAIEALIGQIHACTDEGRFEEATVYNNRLHTVINRACGLERLRAQIRELWEYSIQRHSMYYGVGTLRAVAANEEHRTILQALRARDADVAESLIRAHFWSAADLFAAHIANRA